MESSDIPETKSNINESNSINVTPEEKEIPKNILYLGLEVTESVEILSNLMTNSLKDITEEYSVPEASKLIKMLEENTFESPENYKKPWKYPKDTKIWHITTLFKSGKRFLKSHPAYISFVADQEISVEIRGLVYVPGKIITSIVYVETPVQNEFPHMTTLLGKYAAKNSNDVCRELFLEGKELEAIYKSIMEKEYTDKENKVMMLEANLIGQDEIVYFVKFGSPIVLLTKMKMFNC